MKGNGTVIGVAIDEIDPELRPAKFMRHQRSVAVIEEYSEILDQLDPVILIHDAEAGVFWVADGFHTISAAKRAGHQDVRARVESGSWLDAWSIGSRANAGRGMRTGPADTTHRVDQFLLTPQGKAMRQKDAAQILDVTQAFISQRKGHLYKTYTSDREYDPDGLTPKERLAADVMAKEPGLTAEEVAEKAGVSKGTVINARRKLGLTESSEPINGEADGQHEPLPGQTSFLDGEEEDERPEQDEPEPEPEPDPGQAERDQADQAAARWQKTISDYCILIDSVRRRGGGKTLARNWSTDRINETISLVDRMISGFQEIRDGFSGCLAERD